MNNSQDRKAAIKKLKTLVYSTKQDLDVFRRNIDKTFYTPEIPCKVECNEHKYAEIKCDVLMPELYSTERIMIYIHGGSFVGGSRKTYRSFCASLASATSCRIVVPEFRLAPAYTFPNGIEDLQLVFRSVFTEEQIARSLDSANPKKPEQPEILIAADGSGASLAMALLLNLRERYRECISHVILFSPWLNVTSDSPLIKEKKVRDEVMSGDCLRRSADVYTYETNLSNPLVSPVLATKEALKGFPPVYIQMGEKEILLDDAKQFQRNLNDADCECILDIWPGMMFMFQMADEYLEESHLAIEKIGKFITYQEEKADELTLTRAPILENSLESEA
ncbi:alpha/beta hydrolase fold domain-containing protein [Treponema sp.]|uniref:alpha/beta hydrolase fold domain-containing protein n=1 Tax=Treponema sp. TaxID=166 RepID=UPI00298ECC7D|nr:alpha/beta hydrolase fold domain-containing protein [Treponema sp.]MCR5613904.1 alpha/beta hydrolase [Treponema sp.]